MDVIKPLQQCTICSKMFQFKCQLKDHIEMHIKAEAQICSARKIQFRRNYLLNKYQTEYDFNKNKKNISGKNHNETNNEEFVPSFALTCNNSNVDICFDITKKRTSKPL